MGFSKEIHPVSPCIPSFIRQGRTIRNWSRSSLDPKNTWLSMRSQCKDRTRQGKPVGMKTSRLVFLPRLRRSALRTRPVPGTRGARPAGAVPTRSGSSSSRRRGQRARRLRSHSHGPLREGRRAASQQLRDLGLHLLRVRHVFVRGRGRGCVRNRDRAWVRGCGVVVRRRWVGPGLSRPGCGRGRGRGHGRAGGETYEADGYDKEGLDLHFGGEVGGRLTLESIRYTPDEDE